MATTNDSEQRRMSQDSTAAYSPVRRTGIKRQASMMPQMLEIAEHAVFGTGSGVRGAEEFLKEMEYRPGETQSLKEGVLKKRVVSKDILWSERYITLTAEKIFIRNTQDGEVRDTIGGWLQLRCLLLPAPPAQVTLTCIWPSQICSTSRTCPGCWTPRITEAKRPPRSCT